MRLWVALKEGSQYLISQQAISLISHWVREKPVERKKVVAMEQKILHLSDKNVQISQRLSGCGEDVAEPESR